MLWTMDCNCRFRDCVDKKRLLENQGCWLFQVPFKQSHPVIFSDLFRKRHVGIDNLFHVRGRLSLKNRLQVTIASLIAYMSPTCTGRLHGS